LLGNNLWPTLRYSSRETKACLVVDTAKAISADESELHAHRIFSLK
jgi:hypothetical protein